MLFNSLDFAVFLPIVFVLYWFVLKNNLKLQNILIVISSYIFYGWWNWKFLALILFSTLVDYYIGILLIKKQESLKRRFLLLISISVNLSLLGFFKYFNFFLDNFISAFSFFGMEINVSSLSIILPVGISFYTFQTMSYTIDIYKGKLQPTKDFISFAAFVSFFPQLVAGPIERATSLLPQFYKKRRFLYASASDGLRQILWGLFKKIVIADNCAPYVNEIFNHTSAYGGSTLALGAILFSFQIYCDFSGYSDIAIGTSRLFGFNLKQNFAFPYFSRDIAEFWRRWHISLSTWFRDYLYIPLGGSRGNNWIKIKNICLIFIISGLWHGANWTFIFWGALNALFFIPLMITKSNRKNIEIVTYGKLFPTLAELASILFTFGLTSLAWIFFRADSIRHAFQYIYGIFDTSLFSLPELVHYPIYCFIIFMIVVEWLHRTEPFGLSFKKNMPRMLRWSFYLIITIMTASFFGKSNTFIYFQF